MAAVRTSSVLEPPVADSAIAEGSVVAWRAGRHSAVAANRPVVAVYGTLRRGQPNHGLVRDAEFLGMGSIAGALRDMPVTAARAYGYPALIDDESGGWVVVELYRLPDAALLGRLDELEAYRPDDEAGSEYIRREVDVRDGPVGRAWVYRFNGDPATTGDPIAEGDWVAFLRARGRARQPNRRARRPTQG